MMPPAPVPEKWLPSPYSGHDSLDEWMRCHGMDCDVYERTTRKLALIKIGVNGGDMDQDPMVKELSLLILEMQNISQFD